MSGQEINKFKFKRPLHWRSDDFSGCLSVSLSLLNELHADFNPMGPIVIIPEQQIVNIMLFWSTKGILRFDKWWSDFMMSYIHPD